MATAIPTLTEIKAFEAEADSFLASVATVVAQADAHKAVLELFGLGALVADADKAEAVVKAVRGVLSAVESATNAV